MPRGTQETRAGPAAEDQASGGGDQLHKADLQQILADLNERVAEVDFKSIGVVGLVLLIWAAISLVVTVEQCFNRVYQCSSGRSWLARITTYWAVITLGPVLVALSIWLTGAVLDAIGHFAQTGLGQGAGAVDGPRTVPSGVLAYLFGILLWLLQAVTWLAALFVSVLLMFLLYMMMPNTRVRLKPAIIGGVVAALLWEIAKFGFRIYVDKAVAISALYGSLGLIPLFLLWLYLTWMIILFGLELTYTLQAMPQGRFQRLRESRDAATDSDPVWLVSLLVIIGRAFSRGEASDEGEIAGELGLPLVKVQALCRRLHQAKILNQLECDDRSLSGCEWALAAPPDQIVLDRVLKVGDELTNNRRDPRALPAGRVVEQMRQAQRDSVGKQTLAQVIADRGEGASEPEGPSPPAGATPEMG